MCVSVSVFVCEREAGKCILKVKGHSKQERSVFYYAHKIIFVDLVWVFA